MLVFLEFNPDRFATDPVFGIRHFRIIRFHRAGIEFLPLRALLAIAHGRDRVISGSTRVHRIRLRADLPQQDFEPGYFDIRG